MMKIMINEDEEDDDKNVNLTYNDFLLSSVPSFIYLLFLFLVFLAFKVSGLVPRFYIIG